MNEIRLGDKQPPADCGHEAFAVYHFPTGPSMCAPCYVAKEKAAYPGRVKVLRREMMRLEVGEQTLVGVFMPPPGSDQWPIRRGNCCSVLNMYAENVEEALRRWPALAQACEFEIVELDGRVRRRVVDPRIPEAWRKLTCSVCRIYEEGN